MTDRSPGIIKAIVDGIPLMYLLARFHGVELDKGVVKAVSRDMIPDNLGTAVAKSKRREGKGREGGAGDGGGQSMRGGLKTENFNISI